MMKRLMIVLMCIVLLLFGGCRINERPVDTTEAPVRESAPARDTEAKLDGQLDIYYLSETVSTARNVVYKFARSQSYIKINATAFESVEEMDQQITSDIMRGDGPDVILFPKNTQLDTAKLALNGTFLDLSPMLQEDEAFLSTNYYPVLDAGIIGDGQYLMPLRMEVLYMMTTQKRFESSLALEDDYTLEQLMQALAENAAWRNPDESAMHTMYSFDAYLYDLLRLTGVQLVDLAELKQTVDKATFLEYAQFAQMAYGQCLSAAMQMRDYGTSNLGEMLRRNTVVLTSQSLPCNLRYFSSLYSGGLDEEIRLVTHPCQYNTGSLIADISLYAAVLSNSDNPQGAYNFVRYAMDFGFENINEQMPVCREGVDDLLAVLSGSQGKTVIVNSRVVVVDKMSPEREEMCRNLLDRITEGSISNGGLRRIVSDVMNAFVKGESEFERCWEQFESETECYLYELFED